MKSTVHSTLFSSLEIQVPYRAILDAVRAESSYLDVAAVLYIGRDETISDAVIEDNSVTMQVARSFG